MRRAREAEDSSVLPHEPGGLSLVLRVGARGLASLGEALLQLTQRERVSSFEIVLHPLGLFIASESEPDDPQQCLAIWRWLEVKNGPHLADLGLERELVRRLGDPDREHLLWLEGKHPVLNRSRVPKRTLGVVVCTHQAIKAEVDVHVRRQPRLQARGCSPGGPHRCDWCSNHAFGDDEIKRSCRKCPRDKTEQSDKADLDVHAGLLGDDES